MKDTAGRGAEEKWMSRRDQLAQGGFCIEYSATFKEVVGKDDAMRDRYARSILFDYSYRRFYRDGYGKVFRILNLEAAEKQYRYLVAALLLFHQQMRAWIDGGELIKPFAIEKPLWVFIGHTVTATRAENADDKAAVSDVVAVLRFFQQFLADPALAEITIRSLLKEGYLDRNGRDLRAHRLPHLNTGDDPAKLGRALHAQSLTEIFHAPGGGVLAVQLLKSAAGELAVNVGDQDPFGVVNVGNPEEVAKACEEQGIVKLEDDLTRPSLFHGISRDDSPVHLLVGSRKFTEGWNSYRVSSIGLMHMGKSEGTQIIQMFGRGVRLWGYRRSLRRSTVLSQKPLAPKHLREVETLQVFGVKASYMSTFRDWILSEVPEAAEKEIWDLPVVATLPKRKLQTLKLKDEIDGVRVLRGEAFRQLGPLVQLRPPHETAKEDAWLRAHRTKLNWLPRIRGLAGSERKIGTAIGETQDLPRQKFRPCMLGCSTSTSCSSG